QFQMVIANRTGAHAVKRRDIGLSSHEGSWDVPSTAKHQIPHPGDSQFSKILADPNVLRQTCGCATPARPRGRNSPQPAASSAGKFRTEACEMTGGARLTALR